MTTTIFVYFVGCVVGIVVPPFLPRGTAVVAEFSEAPKRRVCTHARRTSLLFLPAGAKGKEKLGGRWSGEKSREAERARVTHRGRNRSGPRTKGGPSEPRFAREARTRGEAQTPPAGSPPGKSY